MAVPFRKFHLVSGIPDPMDKLYKGLYHLQYKTLVKKKFRSPFSHFSPSPPCLPPSVLLFQHQPHSSAPQAYIGAPLCNAGSFWFSGVTKKMQKGRRDAHEEASVDVMCHYRWFFFFLFFRGATRVTSYSGFCCWLPPFRVHRLYLGGQMSGKWNRMTHGD